MPRYRIHRMKDHRRDSFRWAPHTKGESMLKLRDYAPDGEVEAENAYAAWSLLRDSERALDVGDLLETETAELRIYKYVGFEEAHWEALGSDSEAGAGAPGVVHPSGDSGRETIGA